MAPATCLTTDQPSYAAVISTECYCLLYITVGLEGLEQAYKMTS